MVKAKDIMKTEVITVRSETSIEDLGRMFIEKNISGAPVVTESGVLCGVVTENDLISQNTRFHIPTILRIFDAIIPLVSSAKMEKEIKKMTATTVGEICSEEIVTVGEETSLEDIATIMTDKKIHLLPVVENDKVVGIIGKKDVIRGISGGA